MVSGTVVVSDGVAVGGQNDVDGDSEDGGANKIGGPTDCFGICASMSGRGWETSSGNGVPTLILEPDGGDGEGRAE